MRIIKWYRYTFADGYVCICAGMSSNERKIAERDHGKIVSITYEGRA